MRSFMSDNVTPACPEVMRAVIEANDGDATSYGDDPWSAKLQADVSEVFETEVTVFPVVTGTIANALAVSALTPGYGKIYCHELAHINTDECAAPELFTGGAKLAGLPGDDGKLDSRQLADAISGAGNVHLAQPSVVSITQACETGAVYELDEIASISEIARSHKLKMHMDGARFANALVALGVSPAEMTWKSGVDVLSFGGTKNGCLAAEAVLFFNPELAKSMPYLHKRSGQLLSKMRFVAAQLSAYLDGGLWLDNARNANAMALRLSEGLAAQPGLELVFATRSNEVFVRMPPTLVERLQQDGISINDEELDGSAVRFVTAWNTSSDDVDSLLGAIARHCG